MVSPQNHLRNLARGQTYHQARTKIFTLAGAIGSEPLKLPNYLREKLFRFAKNKWSLLQLDKRDWQALEAIKNRPNRERDAFYLQLATEFVVANADRVSTLYRFNDQITHALIAEDVDAGLAVTTNIADEERQSLFIFRIVGAQLSFSGERFDTYLRTVQARILSAGRQYDYDALIVTAMDEEFKPYLSHYELLNVRHFRGAKEFAFTDKEGITRRGVAFSIGKSGQPSAAATTQALLQAFRPRRLLIAGVAVKVAHPVDSPDGVTAGIACQVGCQNSSVPSGKGFDGEPFASHMKGPGREVFRGEVLGPVRAPPVGLGTIECRPATTTHAAPHLLTQHGKGVLLPPPNAPWRYSDGPGVIAERASASHPYPLRRLVELGKHQRHGSPPVGDGVEDRHWRPWHVEGDRHAQVAAVRAPDAGGQPR